MDMEYVGDDENANRAEGCLLNIHVEYVPVM